MVEELALNNTINNIFLIDTHSHIDMDDFSDDLDAVIKNAADSGVKKIIVPSVDKNSFGKVIKISENYEIPSDPHIACLDDRKVSFPVIIRKWKPGDYFYPLGMNQKKKLSDYLIDKKYSIFDKENIFILESDNKIMWIIGDRIDDRFKITSSTKKGLLLKSKRKALIIKSVR